MPPVKEVINIPARPTTYKGIRMRSRLEADYAAELDRGALEWEYEGACYASSQGQWLPDFTVRCGSDTSVLIEVKPAGPLRELSPASAEYIEHADAFLRQMTIARESDPKAILQLVFWNYGGPAYLTIYSGPFTPWMAEAGGVPVELLWPGMGQLDRMEPPHDIAAEQNVLGSMLIGGAALTSLVPEDYWRPAHRLIHAAILDLSAGGQSHDAAAVAEWLNGRKGLVLVGGAAYLHTLLSLARPEDAGDSARIVAALAIARSHKPHPAGAA